MTVYKNLTNFFKAKPGIVNKSVGFVPTMGALHDGHRSLVRKCIEENDLSTVSLFLNPTQFENENDLVKYPTSFEKDLELLKSEGVDIVLAPTYEEIYPDNYRYKISENDFSKKLCGKNRLDHFDAVLTVVMKLLNIVRPKKVYFGEKDFQQMKLVKGMIDSFFLDVELVSCPIVRNTSGLALSSRNNRLSPSELKVAENFNKILGDSKSVNRVKENLENAGLRVDYVEDIGNRRFGAVKINEIRLIDNVEI